MMEISVLIEEGIVIPFTEDWLRGIAERALTSENISDPVEMGLVITGDEQVHELNRLYRGIDATTDVLSFAASEEKEGEDDFISPPDGVRHLGEVIISYPQTVKQAGEQSQPVAREIALLIVHGVLHLLGYDHDEPEHEAGMKAREAAILDTIGEIAS